MTISVCTMLIKYALSLYYYTIRSHHTTTQDSKE